MSFAQENALDLHNAVKITSTLAQIIRGKCTYHVKIIISCHCMTSFPLVAFTASQKSNLYTALTTQNNTVNKCMT